MGVGGDLGRAGQLVDDICETAHNGDELLESLDTQLRRHLPYQGACWFATDPATLLATTPSRLVGIGANHCDSYWHREFFVDDALLYRDLQRAPVPAGSLRAATDDHPVRSARYREFLEPQGYDDELRAVFKLGDSTWGLLGLFREKGAPAFSAQEVEFIAGIAGTVARALRTHTRDVNPWIQAPYAPGLAMFDGENELVSANDEAREWLKVIGPNTGIISLDPAARTWLQGEGPDGTPLGVPAPVMALIARARAVADGHEPGPARMRLRGLNGQWLVLHASCMSNGSGAVNGTVAVVVEPAKSSDIAPIIVEAYALSPRERDVVRAISRGMTSAEIATELFLSPHTVRDYVKSVFEKVGVSSRGELVAKLFAEHYSDALHVGAVHS
jgi:DNA-binding CsgD family transcriptional regulator